MKESGLNLKEVAVTLNQEGIASLRGAAFSNGIISRLLTNRGISSPSRRKRRNSIELGEHEWWLPDMAEALQMPKTTLSHWYMIGWVRGRKLPGLRGRLVLWADQQELDRLRHLRTTRRRWSDCPYPQELTTPNSSPTR